MKISYVEFKDHTTDQTVSTFTEKELDAIAPLVVHIGGIVLREDEESVILGMVIPVEDNPILEFQGTTYRVPFLILKDTITRRVDFEIPSKDEGVEG